MFLWGSFEDPAFMFRDPYVPQRILKDEKIVQIASGRDHIVALNASGVVFTMGCGAHGQLGRVSRRSSLDGGRQGYKLLLAPDRLHKDPKHKADKIWATQKGTFYRDMKSGQIFGCGFNVYGNVAAAKEKDLKMDFIFKPVLTTFKNVKVMGESLIMLESGDLFYCPSSGDEEIFKWTSLRQKGTGVHMGPSATYFSNSNGDVFLFKGEDSIAPIYLSAENKNSRVSSVCQAMDKLFLLIV